MKIRNRDRATLWAVVGAYVIYLAYEIIRNKTAGESEMPMWACILSAVLLGAAGISVLILAWKEYHRKDPEEDKKPEDSNSLK